MRNFWPYLWENRLKPESVTRKFGKTLTRAALNIYVSQKLNSEGNPEKQAALTEFVFQLTMLSSTTETVIYDLFECGLFSRFPLIEEVKKLDDKHVSFVYGNEDWVDSSGAEVILTEKNKGLYQD